MTLTIQSSSEYIELIHESMDKTHKAIDYAVNDDNYFAVICDDQIEAVHIFSDYDMLLEFIEVNTEFDKINIQSFEDLEDMIEYIKTAFEV